MMLVTSRQPATKNLVRHAVARSLDLTPIVFSLVPIQLHVMTESSANFLFRWRGINMALVC